MEAGMHSASSQKYANGIAWNWLKPCFCWRRCSGCQLPSSLLIRSSSRITSKACGRRFLNVEFFDLLISDRCWWNWLLILYRPLCHARTCLCAKWGFIECIKLLWIDFSDNGPYLVSLGFESFMFSWFAYGCNFGASVTNLNEPLRALATSTIAWVRS